MQHDATRVERLGVIHRAAFLQNQLQHVADVFVRAKHVGLHHRLANFLDHARVGQVRRVIDQQRFAARRQDLVNRRSDTWR